MHCLILAKAPLPGRAKTRLIPAFGADGAAALATAALTDTFAAARASRADRIVVSFDGDPTGIVPTDFEVVAQRSGSLADRLAGAWADAGGPGIQIGMDTPQVTGRDLDVAFDALARPGVGSVLGLAEDGGWWALGLRRARDARLLDGVPMSTPATGALTLAALRQGGLRVELLAMLRDVDDVTDIAPVAEAAPGTRFAALAATLAPVIAA